MSQGEGDTLGSFFTYCENYCEISSTPSPPPPPPWWECPRPGRLSASCCLLHCWDTGLSLIKLTWRSEDSRTLVKIQPSLQHWSYGKCLETACSSCVLIYSSSQWLCFIFKKKVTLYINTESKTIKPLASICYLKSGYGWHNWHDQWPPGMIRWPPPAMRAKISNSNYTIT